MQRSFKLVLALASVAALSPAVAQSNGAPVVTVLAFDNAAFGPAAKEYDGIGKGIMDLVITDLASTSKVRVVDRSRIQSILEEQNLTKAGAIDGQTAVRIGRLFGACYSIYGSFVRNDKTGENVLTIHTTSNETGQIQNSQKVSSKGDDMLGLIAEASSKFVNAMNVSACPGNAGASRSGDAAPAQQGSSAPAAAPAPAETVEYAKPLTKPEQDRIKSVKLDARTMLVYSRALDARDRKDVARARQLAQQVKAKYPNFVAADQLLDSLESGN